MPEVELTTMVMLEDPATGKVLVQDREKSWRGISFPGGHVEDGEAFADCAAREILEETGLTVTNLRSCGVIHWVHKQTSDRYLVFLYKTSDFSGELLGRTDEGRNFWMTRGELFAIKNTENSFEIYYPMFFEDKYFEAYGPWDDKEPWEIIYK